MIELTREDRVRINDACEKVIVAILAADRDARRMPPAIIYCREKK